MCVWLLLVSSGRPQAVGGGEVGYGRCERLFSRLCACGRGATRVSELEPSSSAALCTSAHATPPRHADDTTPGTERTPPTHKATGVCSGSPIEKRAIAWRTVEPRSFERVLRRFCPATVSKLVPPPARDQTAAAAALAQPLIRHEDSSRVEASGGGHTSYHAVSEPSSFGGATSTTARPILSRPPDLSRPPLIVRRPQMWSNEVDVANEAHLNAELDLEGSQLWQAWPGNNRPIFKGRFLCGPDHGVIGFNIFLIASLSVIFQVWVAPRLHWIVNVVEVVLVLVTLFSLAQATWTEAGILPRQSFQRLQHDYTRLPTVPPMVKVVSQDGSQLLSIPNGMTEVDSTPIQVDPVTGERTALKFCSTCKIFRPTRAKHCRSVTGG